MITKSEYQLTVQVRKDDGFSLCMHKLTDADHKTFIKAVYDLPPAERLEAAVAWVNFNFNGFYSPARVEVVFTERLVTLLDLVHTIKAEGKS